MVHDTVWVLGSLMVGKIEVVWSAGDAEYMNGEQTSCESLKASGIS